MDRYAIFVDAGYVYGAGGELVLDTPQRNQVSLDHRQFISRIRAIVEADFPRSGEFLRMYWYDAAPNAAPQREHEEIATQAGVKVRLGRLTRQGQKGVDSLVLRDMMRLSAEHAICTAFLLTGDEDLRQGVIEAQDYGVRVVLIGIQPTYGQNQAEPLVHEADELRVLSFEELHDCFERLDWARGGELDAFAVGWALGEEWVDRLGEEEARRIAEQDEPPAGADEELTGRLLEVGELPSTGRVPVFILDQARAGLRSALQAGHRTGGEDGQAAAEPEAALAARVVESPPSDGAASPASPARVEPPAGLPDGQVWAFREGAEFGLEWLNEQPLDEVRFLRASFPFLPREADVELLRRLVREMGLPSGAHIEDDDRRAARAGFWQTLGLELDLGIRRRPDAEFPEISEREPIGFGHAFAAEWAKRAAPGEEERARTLRTKRVGLPSEVDRLLLRLAARTFGDPVPVDVRHQLREGFGRWLDGA